MQNPRKLKIRGESRTLVIETYRLTAAFPAHERFGLTSQMQRAAVSVGSNVTEGCGRQGARAMIAYLHQSIGSLNELEFQLEVAEDLGYCDSASTSAVMERLLRTRKMIISLIVVLRERGAEGPTAQPSRSST